MNVTIVVPTHNRLEYTQKCLSSLLADPAGEFDLYLWDNASTDDTAEYLKSLDDPRIKEVYISKTNDGQVGAMNWAWSKTSAELVGKVDNDCMMTLGWTKIFAKAHKDIANLGSLACWHFPASDFDEKLALKKIIELNGHKIFRHPWTCGAGFIMKRKTFIEMGPWEKGSSVGTTGYFMKMALAGYINGWYYPLVLQEHMDDPKSSYCMIKDAESFQRYKNTTFGLKSGLYDDIDGRLKRREEILRNLHDDPYDVRYYTGWRKRVRQCNEKLNRLFKGGQ